MLTKNDPDLLDDDNELEEDARHFARAEFGLKDSEKDQEFTEKLIRAAYVARDAGSMYLPDALRPVSPHYILTLDLGTSL